MENKPTIYFFRSLNTSGSDMIQIGPFGLGSFWTPLEKQLSARSLDFRPVRDMGGGPLEEQAAKALRFIKSDQKFKSTTEKFHFFGHSAGGLVMKMVAMDPEVQSRLISVVSMGTPHKGTPLADWAAGMDKTNPHWMKLLRWLGYDVPAKQKTFQSFSAASKMEFLIPDSIFRGSVLCAPQKKTWSKVYRWIHRIIPKNAIPEPCDGLIELETQKFGDHFWNFNLDHIQQMGFGGQRKEFVRLCDFLSELWLDLEERKEK